MFRYVFNFFLYIFKLSFLKLNVNAFTYPVVSRYLLQPPKCHDIFELNSFTRLLNVAFDVEHIYFFSN